MADITADQSIDDLESQRRLSTALGVAALRAMQSSPLSGTAPGGSPPASGSTDAAQDDGSSDLIKALSMPAPAAQPDPRAVALRQQADAIPASGVEPVTNWKQALFNAATKILPVALTAKFAGPAAGAGAAEGTLNATRQFALDQQNRRAQLLSEAQQAEQQDEKQREFNLEDQSRQAQIVAATQRAQQERADQQATLQERGREFQITNQDRLDQETANERRHQEDLQEKQREFNLNQAKPAKESGTFTLAEDGQGNPVLFNSKTGETKPAPNGLAKSGTFSKNKAAQDKVTEPVTAAQQYANDYLTNGVFTGPGDEALQEKFFELAKPSTGFRMTQQQMDMLNNSRSWFNTAEAKELHAKTGQWFSPDQRQQIVSTMNDLAKSKLKSSSNSGKSSGTTSSNSDPLAIR